METEYYKFGPYKIDPKEVFYSTDLSYAMVNLRPVVPGNCSLLNLRRNAAKCHILFDLCMYISSVGELCDGPEAGQTVAHVHIHILPRKSGDFEKNDEIYDAIDEKENELKQKLDLDKERKDRSLDEMAEEAAEYRKLFS
ncbi:hypothetical protein M9H77_01063 [Catharanthus roseus]|uniref:Uncharacterized protein n=1 Tax=Catharanthus roseus TaxID=4058 RepID=A0ACC0C4K0_CATRO|nr:hypothetical protein M9H77_01063 [Catharanthus roseus]